MSHWKAAQLLLLKQRDTQEAGAGLKHSARAVVYRRVRTGCTAVRAIYGRAVSADFKCAMQLTCT